MPARTPAKDRCRDRRRRARLRYSAPAPRRDRVDSPSPRKPFTAELHRQQIGQQAGVPAIAVRERVNLHQPVMEAQRDFIGWIRFVFDPCLGVVKQLAQHYWNLPVIVGWVARIGAPPETPRWPGLPAPGSDSGSGPCARRHHAGEAVARPVAPAGCQLLERPGAYLPPSPLLLQNVTKCFSWCFFSPVSRLGGDCKGSLYGA